MNIDVVPIDDLGAEEIASWARIQHSDPHLASPFLGHTFASACARVRPRTRVAVLRDGGGIAGFFPFEAGRAGSGRALGSGFSDIQGLVAPGSAEVDVHALLHACGLRRWEFDHLLAAQGNWLAGAPHRWEEDRSPLVDLGEGWPAYEQALKERSRSLQSTTARRRRGLEREHGPVTLTFSEPDHAILDQVLEWKSQQYRRTGRRDVFARPGMKRLVHDLLDLDGPETLAPLAVLRAGDEIVAAHLGLRSPTVLAWWFPVYATRFARYSPGLVLTLELLRAMPDQGLALLDLGKGEESYKDRLANARIPILSGAVSRDRVTAGIDAARRWPAAATKTFLRENPAVREKVRAVRGRVAALRTTWTEPAPQP